MAEIADPVIGQRAQAVAAYHNRTKHRLDKYAAGPETLDWDGQPSPYRCYEGAPLVPLPLVSDGIDAPFAAVTGQQAVPPAALDSRSLAALLELSFGLAAIKEYGPDRWALRCNPSSGNLHPTEAYVIADGVAGLDSGVHHYRADSHALEQRCAARLDRPGLWIGLSSVLWREAWKYGERAFRYCQLDVGHALGAVAAACAVLGWRAHLVAGVGSEVIGDLLGLGRAGDFGKAEREDPEALLYIQTDALAVPDPLPQPSLAGATGWAGAANLLDPHPMYRWPVIDEVAGASHGVVESLRLDGPAPVLPARQTRAAGVILKRRSAQGYVRDHVMPQGVFARMIDSVAHLLQGTGLHLLVFVNNVEGLERGLYALPGDPAAEPLLRAALDKDFLWRDVAAIADTPSFRLLASGDFRKLVRALTCHQAIGADASVTICMLAQFAGPVAADPARYRHRHWQAGLIGQRLYLEAGAAAHSGTGIGCFLDDEVHRLLGLSDDGFQALYHFAVGLGVWDARIRSEPAYPGRTRNEAAVQAA